MKRQFVYAQQFNKSFDGLELTLTDLIAIEDMLLENPTAGAVIRGTGGVRKMRFALQSRGKSGGSRILYVDFATYGKIYMLDIYTKNVKETLSDNEKSELKKLTNILKNSISR
jgi:hypothetical protein